MDEDIQIGLVDDRATLYPPLGQLHQPYGSIYGLGFSVMFSDKLCKGSLEEEYEQFTSIL